MKALRIFMGGACAAAACGLFVFFGAYADQDTSCKTYQDKLKSSFGSDIQAGLKKIQYCLNGYFADEYLLEPADDSTDSTTDTSGETSSSGKQDTGAVVIDFVKTKANGELEADSKQDPLDLQLKNFEMLITALESYPDDILCYTEAECKINKYCKAGMAALFEKDIEKTTDQERLEKLRLRVLNFINQSAMCGGITPVCSTDVPEFACSDVSVTEQGMKEPVMTVDVMKGVYSNTWYQKLMQGDLAALLEKLDTIAQLKANDDKTKADAVDDIAACLDAAEAFYPTEHLCALTDNTLLLAHPDNKSLSLVTRLTNLEIRTTALEVMFEDEEYSSDNYQTKQLPIPLKRIQDLAKRVAEVITRMDESGQGDVSGDESGDETGTSDTESDTSDTPA